MALSGPRTGRLLGSLACLLGGFAVAFQIIDRGQLDWLLLGPAVVVQVAVLVRLGLLVLLAHEPRSDRRPRLTDEQAARVLGATEVAVIAVDESLPTVRTALVAACDVVGPQRVLLVSSDERHRDLATRMGVRAIQSEPGWQGGLEAAVEAATASFMAITSASTAIVPRTLTGLARYVGPRCAWVQTLAVAPEQRRPLDHLDQMLLGPAIDGRRVGAWSGAGSLVTIEPIRAAGVGHGPLATSIVLQQQGWHGRSVRGTLALAQGDANAVAAGQAIDASAARIRVLGSRRSPLWARRLTLWQRLAHLRTIADDLAGAVYAVAVMLAVVALVVGIHPIPLTVPVVVGVAASTLLAAAARWMLSDRLLRPGRLLQSTADEMATGVLALGRALRVRRAKGTRSVATVAIVALEGALVMRALVAIVGDDAGSSTGVDLALLVIGLTLLVPLLGATNLIVRARTLRASRRAPAPMSALVGAYPAQVIDLGADGIGMVVRGLVDLLSTVTVRLLPPDRAPIELRGQVVRARAVEGGTLIGVRLIGGVGRRAMDDYVRLWIDRVSRSAIEWPELRRDDNSRPPVRRRGLGLLRLATVFTLVTVGVASLPPYTTGVAAPVRSELAASTAVASSVLFGAELPVDHTICNRGAQTLVAVSARVVLPAGVDYIDGSSTHRPAGVLRDQPSTGSTTVLWESITDLTAGACVDLAYRLAPATGAPLRVGDVVAGSLTASASVGEADVRTTRVAFDTTIAPITIRKVSTATDGRVVRRARPAATEFTLLVDTTSAGPVEAVVIDDYLPAGIEFLGCGADDECQAPDSSEQVRVDPDGAGPLDGGLHTHLRWNLGTLDAGTSLALRYAVGVSARTPLATIAAANAVYPSDTGPRQWGSALASLVPVDVAVAMTACSDAAGSAAPAQGSCDTGVVAGGSTTWTAAVRTSEYRSLAGTTVTATVGDGLVYTPGSALLGSGSSSPAASEPAVEAHADGTQTLTWAVAETIAPDSTFTIAYGTTTLAAYRGTGSPVLVFDRLTTAVAVAATGVAAGSESAQAPVEVREAAATSIAAEWPGSPGTATDQMLSLEPTDGPAAAGVAGTESCASGLRDATDQQAVGYRPGDLACLELRFVAPTGVAGRDASVTVELPDRALFQWFAPYADHTPAAVVQVDAGQPSRGSLTFHVGMDPAKSPRYTAPGQVVHLLLAVRLAADPGSIGDGVVAAAASATLTGGGGRTATLRSETNVRIVTPRPAVAIAAVDVRRDGRSLSGTSLAQSDEVVVGLDVTNSAMQHLDPGSGGQAGDARDVDVAVVLPDGLGCDALAPADLAGNLEASFAVRAGAVAMPGVADPQIGELACQADVLSFTAATVPAGYDLRAEFTQRVDASAGAGREYPIAAGVRRFADPAGTAYTPADNIDPSIAESSSNSAAVRTSTTLVVASGSMAQRVTTSVTVRGNSATQATIGETATFSVDLTLPPGTTVYDSVAAGSMPAGLAYVASSVRVVSSPLSPVSFGPADAPDGWSLTENADGWSLAMPTGPTGWDSAGPSSATIRIEFDAVVRDVAANTAGVALDPDTVWTWNRTPGSDPAVPQAASPSPVTLVEPSLALTREVAPDGPFVGGDGLFVTMEVANAASATAAHDLVVTECAPAVLGAIVPAVGEGWSAIVGAAGSCASGGTEIDFTAAELASGTTTSLGYTALVTGGVAAGDSYDLVATLTGSSLAGVVVGERTTSVDAGPATITLATPTIAGTTAVSQAAPGQTVDHVYTITVPARTRTLDTTVVATVADGIEIVDFTAPSPSYGPSCVVAGAVGHTIAPVEQVAGWFLGDVIAGEQACVMTVGLRTRIAEGAALGADLAVTVAASWGWADRDADRTTATADGLDRTITATTSLGVVTPAVTIGRSVDDPDREVEGGQSVTHTITIANSGDSTAYRIELSDAVPAGLAATDTFAGTCDGAAAAAVEANALAWTLFAGVTGLDPGASCTVTYRAQLAPATAITDGQTLVSTATVDRYVGDPAEAARPADEQVSYSGKSASTTLTAVRPTLRVDLTAADGSERVATRLGVPTDWRIVVSNVSSGESRLARGIDIVDVLPPNWTFTDVTRVTPQRCAVMPLLATVEQTQTITWSNLCDLQPGEDLTIEYSATAQLGAVGSPGLVDGAGNRIVHTNTATLTAEDAAGTTLGSAENSAGATLESVDLQVRTTDPGPADDGTADSVGFAVGVAGAYFVDVANNGPDAVAGPVTMVDTVPAGYLVTAASGTGWSCTVTTVVTCTNPGPVEVGRALPRITIAGVPTGAALNDADGDADPGTGLAVNRATVSSGQPDRLPTNDTDDESTPVRQLTDFAISAQWSPATPLIAGAQVAATITVITNGPSPGTGPVTVNDELPDGLRLVKVRGAGWNCTGSRVGSGFSAEADTNGRIACSRVIRELAAGSTLEPIEVIVQVDPAQMSATALTAQVSHANDREPGNDSLTVSGTVTSTARLTVRADAGGSPIAVGQAAGVVMVVATNQGPSVERGPVVVDVQLPSGLDRGEVEAPGWACAAARRDDAEAAATDLECTWVGDDATPDPVGVAEVLPTIVLPLSARAEAVESSEPDAPNLARVVVAIEGSTATTPQQDDLDVVIRPVADVVATVAPSDTDPWRAGGSGSYAVVVTNNGPSDEYGPVTVSKPIPLGTTFESGRGDGWSCQVDRGAGGTADLVVCSHARGTALGRSEALLPAGASLSPLMIDVSVGGGLLPGASAAPVTVSGSTAVLGTTDTTWSTVSDQVTVESVVDLSVTRSGEATRLPVAVDVTYEVRVANAGPNPAAAGVTVTDTLPPGVELSSWAGEGWTCLDAATGPTCTFAEPIGVGESRAVSLTVVASAEAYSGADQVEGTLTVSGPNAEARPDDNSLDYAAEVAPLVDLAVTQVQTGRLVVGRRAGFAIEVRNLGPNAPSTEVTVTNDLPERLSYGAVDGDEWECVTEAQRLRCTYRGPIEIDAALPTIEVAVSAETESAEGVDNVVGVWSPDRDVDATNNVASRALVVRRPGSVVAEPFTEPFGTDTAAEAVDPDSAPDLVVGLRTDDAPPLGARGTWHVDVANTGAADAYDVVVSDIVPSIARPLRATADGGLCAIVGQQVRCSFDTIVPDAQRSIAVTVEMTGRRDDRTEPNTATASSSRPDRSTDDNTAELAVPVGLAGAVPFGVTSADAARGDDLPTGWRPVWVTLLGVVALALALAATFVVVVAPQHRPRLPRRRRR